MTGFEKVFEKTHQFPSLVIGTLYATYRMLRRHGEFIPIQQTAHGIYDVS